MWYVIQTRARHELEVVQKCREDVILPGESVFVMMAERMFKQHGEWKLIEDVAFKNYIFAETEDTDDFRIRLKKVREAARFVKVGDDIVPIGEEEEELLKRLGGEEHVIRSSKGIVEGDRLVVTDGPLMGQEGFVIGIDRHRRIAKLEIDLMGQTVTARLGCEVLKKVAEV